MPIHRRSAGRSYRLTLDTRTIPNGIQVISANAVDGAGNRATHRVAVRIDNPMPPPAGSAPGLVIADDLNGDGRYTGAGSEDRARPLRAGLHAAGAGSNLR